MKILYRVIMRWRPCLRLTPHEYGEMHPATFPERPVPALCWWFAHKFWRL